MVEPSSQTLRNPLLTSPKSSSLLSLASATSYGTTPSPSSSLSAPLLPSSSSSPSHPTDTGRVTERTRLLSSPSSSLLNEDDEKWIAAERVYQWGKSVLQAYETEYPENFFTSPMTKNKWIIAAQVSVIFAYILVAVNATYTIVEIITNPQAEIHVIMWAIASIFVSIAVPLSLHDIYLHMLHYVNPLQRYYLRILLMVPIYAIESWLALRFKEQRVYVETAREAYEAFVVFSFTKLMMDFLGSRRTIIAKLQAGPYEVHGMNAIDTGKPLPSSSSSSTSGPVASARDSASVGLTHHTAYTIGSPHRTSNRSNGKLASSKHRNDNQETGDVVTYHLAASNETEVDDSVLIADEQDEGPTSDGARSTTIKDPVMVPASLGIPTTPATTVNVTSTADARTNGKAKIDRTEKGKSTVDASSVSFPSSTTVSSFPSAASSSYRPTWKFTLLLYCCGIAKHRPRDGYAIMLPPFCCLRRWRLGSHFLRNISFGVLQYVVLRTVLGIVTAVLESLDRYDSGDFSSIQSGYMWNVTILNISQTWALYCLALFAFHLWDYLTPMKPLGKFLVVKWVIFLSWWQGLVISVLSANSALPAIPYYSTDETAAGLQDFLICIEMAFAAYIHHQHFSYTDFKNPSMTTALIDSEYASGNRTGTVGASALPLPEEETVGHRSSLSLFPEEDDEITTNDERGIATDPVPLASVISYGPSRKPTKGSSSRASDNLEKEIDAALENVNRSAPSSRSSLFNGGSGTGGARKPIVVKQMQVQNDGQLREISRTTTSTNGSSGNGSSVLTVVKDILPTDVIADTMEHVLSTTSYLKEKTNQIVHVTRSKLHWRPGNDGNSGGNHGDSGGNGITDSDNGTTRESSLSR